MLDSPAGQGRDAAGVAQFSVAVHPHRGQVVVAPSGEVDLATVTDVERELAGLRLVGFDDIVLDLRAVTFMDSTGLRLLLTQAREAEQNGYRFRLAAASPAVCRLLELTGTGQAFEFVTRPARGGVSGAAGRPSRR